MKAIKVRLPIYHFITKMTLDKIEYAKLRLYLKWIFLWTLHKNTLFTLDKGKLNGTNFIKLEDYINYFSK